MPKIRLAIILPLLLALIIPLASVAKKTKLNLRNEFGETLQINLKRLDSDESEKNIYVNAYEISELGELDQGTYVATVYNLNNSFLGFIKHDTETNKKSLISVNRFKLVQHLNGLNQDIEQPVNETEQVQTNENLGSVVELENKAAKKDLNVDIQAEDVLLEQELLAHDELLPSKGIDPVPQARNIFKKKIKIANISEVPVHIDIIEPGQDPLGNGWTVNNDIYVPQFLLLDSKPIEINIDSDMILKGNNGNVLKKKVRNLKIDEKGDYIFVINEQP